MTPKIQLSYETYQLLLDLRDREAEQCQECMWDMECHASRYSEGRLDFVFFSQSGSLYMEGSSR
jgi:hypothetical protein